MAIQGILSVRNKTPYPVAYHFERNRRTRIHTFGGFQKGLLLETRIFLKIKRNLWEIKHCFIHNTLGKPIENGRDHKNAQFQIHAVFENS